MAWIGWQVGEKEVLEKNDIFHLVSFCIKLGIHRFVRDAFI